jgi:polygalacturonase
MTNRRFDRREFLNKAARGALAMPMLSSLAASQDAKKTAPTPQKHAAPAAAQKPALSLSVRDFGATGDGQTKDTAAIQQALDRCGVLGGGEVVVPAGDYSTGALALRSNTVLRLEQNANLLGTADFADYPVTQVRWEGRWIQGHIGLVSAIDADHIGVVGPGRITGNVALGGRRPRKIRCATLAWLNSSIARIFAWKTSRPPCA